MCLQVAVALGISIPELVNIIALAFTGTLTIVEWFEAQRRIAEQRITHDEHIVQLTVTTCNQAATEGILAIECRLHGRHGGSTHLHPYELPVEVEVVAYKLARLKGVILNTTLGKR